MEIALFVLGIIAGVCATCLIFWRRLIGDLRIDRSDPDEPPYMFLETNENIDRISRRKYVMLKVVNKNYISQK